MQGGDIGNTVVPRILVVWEGLVATLPTRKDEVKVAGFIKFHRWKSAVNCFVQNESVLNRVWDLTWRLNFSLDVITYLPEKALDPIKDWIERADIPVGHVTAEDPDVLARKIAYMPYVAAIYDPIPEHRLRFGSKGRYITAENPDFIGVL